MLIYFMDFSIQSYLRFWRNDTELFTLLAKRYRVIYAFIEAILSYIYAFVETIKRVLRFCRSDTELFALLLKRYSVIYAFGEAIQSYLRFC